MSDAKKLKVLFLCTGNSCRSQMAEGWARALRSDVIEVWSAGLETHGLNPRAVQVMAEAGVDISGYRSELVADLMAIPFDYYLLDQQAWDGPMPALDISHGMGLLPE